MIGVEVADADVLDLVRRQLELRKLIGEAHLRGVGIRAGHEARIPNHVLVAVLDDVAAVGERKNQILVGERVGEALADIDRLRARAAIEARERDFGRLREGRQRGQGARDSD